MRSTLSILTLGLLILAPLAAASAQPPALSPIPDVTLNANDTLSLDVVVTDAGGREISLDSSVPDFVSLDSPRVGLGQIVTTLTLSPTDLSVGNYVVAVTATAGGESDTEFFDVRVNSEGSPAAPLVTAPALEDVAFDANLTFAVDVADPDGGGITALEATMLPDGATFLADASNAAGTFSWTPGTANAGEYDVVFTATAANGLSAGAVTHIRVAAPPELMIDPIDDVTVEGGSFVSVPVVANGLPTATIGLTASLPSFAELNPPGSGTGSVSTTISVSPPPGSAGTYGASVTATSEDGSVTELFDIIVTGDGGAENNPPVLSAPIAETVAIGSTLSFLVSAVDPDGDPVDLFGSALPPGSSFVDNGDDTGTFTWSPTADQEGVYLASFSGLDNRGGTGAASTEITVTGAPAENRPPFLMAPTTQQVLEGARLQFAVIATDPDGDPVDLTADGLPPGANFVDQFNDSGVFDWTPGSDQSGTYEVTFTGNDGRGGSGTARTVITVLNVDEPVPCLISGALEVCAGQQTELCGPEGALSYSWTGPDGFAAEARCITVGVAGTYELTVVDAEQTTHTCSATVTVVTCEVSNCPRGPGFWMSQCAQRGNGSTKFDRDQMDQITSCIDESSEFFDWSDDFDGFCATVDPPRPMDLRKQTLRMYATLLANVCTGELGFVASNGATVSLDPATPIDCGHVDGVGTIADLIAEVEQALAELDGLPLTPDVRASYEPLKDCMDAISNGIGIGPTCEAAVDQEDDGGNDETDDEDSDDGNSSLEPGDTVEASGGEARLSPSIYPNPLNPRTEVSFSLDRGGRVRVTVYDVQGRLVKTLMDEVLSPGEHRTRWDGSDQRNQPVPSGVYLIRIQTAQGEATRRATLIK